MTNTQVFNLSTEGQYPFERYVADPITFTQPNLPLDFTSVFWSQLDGSGQSISTGGSLLTRNYLNYHKNPLCQILNYNNPFYQQFVRYNNVNYNRFSDKFLVTLTGTITGNRYIEPVPTITIFNTTTNRSNITLEASALRQNFKTPYEFYFFYVQLNDTTRNSYGYLLYPSKIFLKPKQITNNNGKWQLRSSVDIINSSVVHIQSYEIELDALKIHLNKKETPVSNSISLPPSLSSNKIYFYLYGSRTQINTPTIRLSGGAFGLIHSSSSFNLNSGDIAYIHPDTTFFTYSAVYIDINGQINSITQSTKNDSYLYSSQKFGPSFILDYNPTVENLQKFLLLQSSIDNNFDLGDTQNNILSAGVYLNEGLVNFTNEYEPAEVKFNFKYPLGINYTVDSYNLRTGNTAASGTLTSQQLIVDNGLTSIGRSILDGFEAHSLSASDVIWETSYPPYCYSYKLRMTNQNDDYLDSNNLSFYLKLSSTYQDSRNVWLSAHMASDFNQVVMPILNTDSIKFSIPSTSIDNDMDFISDLDCYYGVNNNQTPYDIINSPYVPVLDNAYLRIDFSRTRFQGIVFSVQASLLSDSGIIDSFDTLDISLAPPEAGTGNRIFLNVLQESSNEIIVDSSLNVNSVDWPARDLRDSKIRWFFGNTPNLSLNYVNDAGEFLAPVTGETTFSDTTWKVKLSGYGPLLSTISLSSQKYNEVATLSTNPNLFDFLSQGKLTVGVSRPLNNLHLTRSVELTAAIPFGNRLFNIPTNYPLNWTWEYDEISDPFLQPIFAQQPLRNYIDYTYSVDSLSTNISAIKINVTPGYSKTSPKLHQVKVTATINAAQPPITGSYIFKVDDFPDPSIFNADFQTYFTGFTQEPRFKIADTRENKNIITRSNLSVLNFTFSARRDVLLNLNGGSVRWYYDNDPTFINDLDYVIQLTDPLSGLPSKYLDGLEVSALNIGLSLEQAIAPGWTSAHNVSATTSIFVLSSVDFLNPLRFLIYPEYAWIGLDRNNTGNLDFSLVTFLTSDSAANPIETGYIPYTQSFAPTAYYQKKSNSQTYWVSANKSYFTEYIYQNLQTYSIVSAPSSYALIDMPYDPTNSRILFGIPISLIAYNKTFYPENTELTYLDHLPDTYFIPLNLRLSSLPNSYLVTQNHNITSRTFDLRGSYFTGDNFILNFFTSPRIVLYPDVAFVFSPVINGKPTTDGLIQVELTGAKISVDQFFENVPPNTAPKVTSGSVTYYLSSKYWTVSSVIPIGVESVSARYDVFDLKYGDPSIPLYTGEMGPELYYLYAKPTVKQQIPWTTFSNYPSSFPQYPKDPSLWAEVNVI